MKDIDEELSAQIKKVFEDFDDGQSRQGWEALREKYPEKSSKKIPLWWISGIAAALLLIGGWLLVFNEKGIISNEQITKNKEQGIKNKEQGATKKEQGAWKKEQGARNNEQPKTNSEQRTTIEVATNNEQGTRNKEQGIKNKEQGATNNELVKENSNIEPLVKNRDYAIVAKPVNNQQQNLPTTAVTAKLPIVDSIAAQQVIVHNADQEIKSKEQGAKSKEQGIKSNEPTVAVSKTTEDFLRNQNQLITASEKDHKPKVTKTTKKSSFEVFTGTFLNYSGDNDVKINAGFGLNANIKVSKSVFLAVGAGLSQNKIGYANQNSFAQDASNSLPMSNAASVVYTSAPFVTDVKLSAQLLAIDLPIVVKFYPTKKQNFYIATGINSNSYLNQQYTYSYNVITPSSFAKTPEVEEQVEKSDLKGFDFANSAIFAIGINQTLGAHQLIFEPYFKPAIGNMGDKNLRINTIGLNLRFNFSGRNK